MARSKPEKKKSDEEKVLRVVGYIRVSTEEQASGMSLEGQEDQIRRYCDFSGHELVELFIDKGKSGRKKIRRREGARLAMEEVLKKRADGIIVWKLDRLGRDANELTEVARDFQRRGMVLISTTEKLDSTNYIGRFFIHLLAGLAEMESGRIGERVEMGMAQLVVHNRVRSPMTPFGFRMPDGKANARKRKREPGPDPTDPTFLGKKTGPVDARPMVEHPGEQTILRDILKMRDKGLGAFRIANALNKKGTKNPRTKGQWWPNSIASILKTVTKRDRILQQDSA